MDHEEASDASILPDETDALKPIERIESNGVGGEQLAARAHEFEAAFERLEGEDFTARRASGPNDFPNHERPSLGYLATHGRLESRGSIGNVWVRHDLEIRAGRDLDINVEPGAGAGRAVDACRRLGPDMESGTGTHGHLETDVITVEDPTGRTGQNGGRQIRDRGVKVMQAKDLEGRSTFEVRDARATGSNPHGKSDAPALSR